MQLEPGFVFVGAAAQTQDGAIRQNDFEAEDIIASDAVFESPQTA